MDIDNFRRKVVGGSYELTQHAKDEAANDNLDIEDIENIILTGKVIRSMTKDPRGVRYIIQGLTSD